MDEPSLFDVLERHLKNPDELELILLKGHLVLEMALNRILVNYIHEAHLSSLNLMFAKKIELVAALKEFNQPIARDELGQLREINRIRNKLAHKLDFAEFHSDLKKWACDVVGYIPTTIYRRRTYRNTLLKAFYQLCGVLFGMAQGMEPVNKNLAPAPSRGTICSGHAA